jgi:formylmethanofuran dehydrogenase subunit D
MKKIILFILATITVSTMWSCAKSNNGNTTSNDGNKVTDSTLCQFNNLDAEKMFAYVNEEGDTVYFDNKFSAFWPQIINGKPCPELQQALFRAMTDSAGLNELDKVTEFLLNPANYTEIDSKDLIPVNAVKDDENKLSTSEIDVILKSMNDRLLVYHLGTDSYSAGAAHGIYANNYVTYDLKTEKAVTFDDIIADTTLLRTVILKSIKQEYNYDTDELFLPDNGLLPLPRDFVLDGQVFHAIYQVYEIASYAQGMIDAPIYPYLLKPEEIKRLFTPYGLELLDLAE